MKRNTLVAVMMAVCVGSSQTRGETFDNGATQVAGNPLVADEVDVLISQLKSATQDRETAAWKLGDLGNAKAVPFLIDALKDGNEIVKRGAAKSLGQIGDARAIDALIEAARAGSVNASWSLKNGKFSLNESQVEALVAVLNTSQHTYIQMNIAPALGFTRNPKAVPSITALLKSKDAHVRKNAAIALGATASRLALEPLISVFQTDSDVNVKSAALIGLMLSGDQRASQVARDALRSEDMSIRGSAVVFFQKVKDRQAVELLIPLLKDKGQYTRVNLSEGFLVLQRYEGRFCVHKWLMYGHLHD